jgi:hypothetical protein
VLRPPPPNTSRSLGTSDPDFGRLYLFILPVPIPGLTYSSSDGLLSTSSSCLALSLFPIPWPLLVPVLESGDLVFLVF